MVKSARDSLMTAARRGAASKKERKIARLFEEFKTCEYPNSGAYNVIPTKRGSAWTERMTECLKTTPYNELTRILNKGQGSWNFRAQCRDELKRRRDGESI